MSTVKRLVSFHETRVVCVYNLEDGAYHIEVPPPRTAYNADDGRCAFVNEDIYGIISTPEGPVLFRNSQRFHLNDLRYKFTHEHLDPTVGKFQMFIDDKIEIEVVYPISIFIYDDLWLNQKDIDFFQHLVDLHEREGWGREMFMTFYTRPVRAYGVAMETANKETIIKKTVAMGTTKELTNYEKLAESCILDIFTAKTMFHRGDKATPGFTGFYHCKINDGRLPPPDGTEIVALYPTSIGPVVYYEGREYQIRPDLTITLSIDGKNRTFKIPDYSIEVNYAESPYIGFDSWSDEIDVDLFFMIEQRYKTDSFYERYTLL